MPLRCHIRTSTKSLERYKGMNYWLVTYTEKRVSNNYSRAVINMHPLLFIQSLHIEHMSYAVLISAIPVPEEVYDQFIALGGFN
jgi:hypothetical protein